MSESSLDRTENAVKEEEKKERPIPIDRGPQIKQYPH